MTRMPPAVRRIQSRPSVGAAPAPPAGVRAQEESPEDRVGARALRQAGGPASADAAAELAKVLNQLLAPAATAKPVLPARARTDTELPPQEPTPAAATPAPPDNAAPPSTPPASAAPPAPAPPAATPAPAQAPIEAPQLPQPHTGTALPAAPAQAGSPGAATPAAKPPAPVPPAPQAADEAPAPGAHRRIVERWRADVAAAGAAVQPPRVGPRPGELATLTQTGTQVRERHAQARAGLPADALATTAPAPEIETPPAAPPGNPVPEHTQRILALSDQRLPDAQPPQLAPSEVRLLPDASDPSTRPSVGGNLPTLGEQPVAPDLFQVLTTPTALALAQIPTTGTRNTARGDEADRLQRAITMLTAQPKAQERMGQGVAVLTPDRGPRPLPPLPPQLQAQRAGVGEVVARLLAQGPQATTDALQTLRAAYPGGVLGTEFPDIGNELRPELASLIDTELREIAGAAGFSREQLQQMEAQRRRELAEIAAAAHADLLTQGQCVADEVSTQGQQTSDAIQGAADAAAEQTLRQQEAATGGTDPQVIHARRDRTVGWIREHVTSITTHYQQAGERRSGELQRVRQEQGNAYRALAQREQFQVLTPQPPQRPTRDLNDAPREALLADLTNAIRIWGDQRVTAVDAAIVPQLSETARLTREHRATVEAAGSAGIEAARAWAEDRELAGQSWWTRIVTRLRRWLTESRQLQEQWQVRRTAENRDAVARDLAVVEAARARLQAGLTQDELLADESLGQQERAILQQYFAGPEKNPLDFAARRLRDSVALGHMDRARQVFEQELIAMPVRYRDFELAEKINKVVRAGGGGDFDAARIAQQLHGAMDQIGTNEAAIYSALTGLSRLQGIVVRKQYYAMFGSDLDDDLESELSGDEEKRAFAALEGDQARADAIALHDAIAGAGTDEAAIMATLRNKDPAQSQAIRDEYLRMYGETLEAALAGDMEGNELDQANALLSGDTALADAIALDEAMRGGLTGWGTGESDIEEVQKRVRDEVLAQAQSRNWTSAQMEAEVRRRLQAIEQKFEAKYKDVAQYNEPGLEGKTVLQRAFRSELSGAELDLANALQRNDLVAADAARIEIERKGFYSSDEKLRGVLQSQYERALQARRLDEGPAQHMQVERLVQQLREQRNPVLSEEEISRRRMALERRLEHEMEDRAQQDSGVAMDALTQTYERNYDRISLAYDMERMTGGPDRVAARRMLRQGGRLSALQEVEYAVAGAGTDEDALRRVFSRLTFKEIQDLRRDWLADHPGEPLLDRLASELSGRDASDILDMATYGAPESALEQIQAEDRRVHRELEDLTGVAGGAAASDEAAWMEHQRDELRKLQEPLRRTDWPDTEEARREREKLTEDVDFRVKRVQEAVDDHRRRLDSYTDMATQIVGMTVGIVVAAVLGAVSGGTLGVVTIAIMASLMATTATMATKALILGGAYGHEDILADAAVGAVDALATYATAGLGSRLLKPMKGLVARTRIGDLAGRLGRTGIAGRIARLPGAGGVLQKAGRAIGGRAGMERMAASFLAEGAEDAVSALPSSLAQMAISDDTWRGDPAMNFLEGGGMAMLQSAGMGRLMAGGMHVGSKAFAGLRGKWRMGSEVGRLLEANRLIQEGYHAHAQDNPGASLGDFLSGEEGRRLRKDIKERGLLPSPERLAAEVRRTAPEPHPEAPLGPRTQAEAHAQRAAELSAGVPESHREHTTIKPDADLEGNTVRVEPRRVDGRIVGVDVRAGPDATPFDIALHAATIDAMQRYRGVLGNVRRVLEDTAALLTGSGLKVGSRGWEARLELGKLSAIVSARMDALEGRLLSPEMALHLRMDVEHLQVQMQVHAAVLKDPVLRGEPGRGYVAAEGKAKKPAREPKLDVIGQARLGMELDRLQQARERIEEAGTDRELRAAVEARDKAIADIHERTRIPPEDVGKFTEPGGIAAEVREHLEAIDNAMRRPDPKRATDADAAEAAARLEESLAAVRELTGLDDDRIVRLARQPQREPALAMLLGVEVPQAPPREPAAAPAKTAAKAVPPPAQPRPVSYREARASTVERVLRGEGSASLERRLADPAWEARLALAAFASTRQGVLPSFDQFLAGDAATHLLGEGFQLDARQRARLEADYRKAAADADRIRRAARNLGIPVDIAESFFAVWSRRPQLGADDIVEGMRRWRQTSGRRDARIFPANLVDAETRRLLRKADRLLSPTQLPQFVQARALPDGALEVVIETALFPATLSRRPREGQRRAPNLNVPVRERLNEGFFTRTGLPPGEWQVMHLSGAIGGIESATGLALGPKEINTGLQSRALFRFDGTKFRIAGLEGIEPFMNEFATSMRREGGDAWSRRTLHTFGQGELPPHLRGEDVHFFKSVEYEIRVSRPGERDTVFTVRIDADAPPATGGRISIIGEVPPF